MHPYASLCVFTNLCLSFWVLMDSSRSLWVLIDSSASLIVLIGPYRS